MFFFRVCFFVHVLRGVVGGREGEPGRREGGNDGGFGVGKGQDSYGGRTAISGDQQGDGQMHGVPRRRPRHRGEQACQKTAVSFYFYLT